MNMNKHVNYNLSIDAKRKLYLKMSKDPCDGIVLDYKPNV